MPSLHRAARGITLWEFLRLKVRPDSDRPNSTPQLAQMIGEFDALLQQLRTTVKDELVPVSTELHSTHPASKILVVSLLHIQAGCAAPVNWTKQFLGHLLNFSGSCCQSDKKIIK